MASNDIQTRISQLSAAKRALLEKRLRGRVVGTSGAQSIARRAGEGAARLSFAQQRLWFIDQLEPESPIYNIPVALRLTGRLNVDALGRSIDEIVRRHEALRTTFDVGPDLEPAQVVSPRLEIPLRVEDLSALPEAEREAGAVRLATREMRRPFDLKRGPLLRARLLRLGAEQHVLLFTMHHIVSDGWSMGVLVREIVAIYAAYVRGKESPLPELPIQYADFAEWQRGWLRGEVLEEQLSYWRRKLGGERAALALPTDRPRPPVPSFHGRFEPFALTKEVSDALRSFSQREGATLFMPLLAAYKLLLYRHTGQEDILVGTPIANRSCVETEDLIGFFVNTLVLRTSLAGDPTFRELLRRVRQTALEAYAHQDLPFEKLVEELAPQRDLSRNPLFQVLLALQNAPMGELDLDGLVVSSQEFKWETVRLDLEFHLHDLPERVSGSLAYNADIFDVETVRRFLKRYATLLEEIVADPDRRISEMPVLTTEERRLLLVEWNDTRAAAPPHQTIQQSFEAQADATPDAEALQFEGRRMSYGELDGRADRLARRLQSLGVGPEVRVGILAERSFEQVIALLGVLKAGGAYVPLSPESPPERLASVLADSGARLLLTQSTLGGGEALAAGGVRVVLIDANVDETEVHGGRRVESGVVAANAAYVIYTSGSTGRPKGIVVSHGSLVHLIHAHLAQDGQFVAGTLLQMSYAFDGSLLSIFAPLCRGGKLVIPREGQHADPSEVARLIAETRLSHLTTVPSFYSSLLDHATPEQLEPLRVVMLGAEVCPRQLVDKHQRALPRVALFNVYGPTETTIYSTSYLCPPHAATAPVSIGRPVNNTQVYLLDERLQPVPVGVTGQLYIGGAGLARGYENHADLTAERFIPNPYGAGPGERLYQTGDLARHEADGNLTFQGRMDHQVKVRGYRIELGEIEAALARHEAVREAVVVAREESAGDRRLVAYVAAARDREITSAGLRDFLRTKLPEYMLPSAFVILDVLPRTPTGKVDRSALPTPERGRDTPAVSYVAPRTPTEELLARLWGEVLKLERVGVGDNFFDLGGHSLLATQLISRMREGFSVDLPLRSIFESPTVERLALRVEAATRDGAVAPSEPLAPDSREGDNLPLSFAQQRLWFIHKLEPSSSAYNMPVAVRLSGTLDVEALGRALGEIVARHESLRTSFRMRDGRPVQLVAGPEEVKLRVHDLGHVPEPERTAEAQRLAAAEARQWFDLERGPLYRAALLRLGVDDHVLLFTMHHIVSDGWSMGVLVREMSALYSAFAEGKPSPLAPLPIQYADFARWQRQHLSGEVLEAHSEYWKRQLGGPLPILELPADRPRPSVQSFSGAGRTLSLPVGLIEKLKASAQREGATLFMLMLAAFKVLLHRYTAQDDVIVGTPIANRNRVEVEGLIGFFVNTLVLRTDLSGRPSFAELLRRVRAVSLEAYAHQDMPFEQLVEQLQPERSMSRSPLFQVMFSLQNTGAEEAKLPGLTLLPVEVERVTTQFDLSLDLHETSDGITAVAEYSTDLFDASTVERMLAHFRAVLEGVAEDPRVSVAELPLLTGGERERLLIEWADGGPHGPVDKCLHELFEAQAARTPHAIAVVGRGEQLTYSELNGRANQLAHHLKDSGVGPESRVCVLMERSPEAVAGLLAVLKAGGAYVPLDSHNPKQRLAYMIEDARAAVLLTQAQFVEEFAEHGAQVIRVDADASRVARQPTHNPAATPAPDNLAYVIYTSGSTGRPKGVGVTHKSLVNHQRAVRDAYGLRAGDRVLQFASLSFDVAAEEIFPTLLCGATLVLRDGRVPDAGPGLARQIEEDGVTVVNLSTSAWHEWVGELSRTTRRLPEHLRLAVTGSERVSRESFAAWLGLGRGGARLINAYGTTETTITALLHEAPRGAEEECAGPTLPIGRPLAGARVYVLDALSQPVPVGVAGQLHVGGAGLARGYLDRPGLTASAFIPDPFGVKPGARLYRTGDLVRYLPGGALEFIGRADHQLKVRGFRVEPGEIEAALNEHAAVRRALVMVRRDADEHERLAAYVVVENERAVTRNELREYLRGRLPEFMVPASFVFVDEFPLTASGKVDRGRLPAPGGVRDEAQEMVLPRTERERVIAAVWRETLGLEVVGVHDNFFDLGGHSLLATQLVSRLREPFHAEIPLRVVFERPTVAGLAEYIEQAGHDASSASQTPAIVPAARQLRQIKRPRKS